MPLLWLYNWSFSAKNSTKCCLPSWRIMSVWSAPYIDCKVDYIKSRVDTVSRHFASFPIIRHTDVAVRPIRCMSKYTNIEDVEIMRVGKIIISTWLWSNLFLEKEKGYRKGLKSYREENFEQFSSFENTNFGHKYVELSYAVEVWNFHIS